MNANPPPIKRRRFIKTEQTKEEKIKEKIMKDNAHWNYRNFQLNCNKIEWVDPKKKHQEE